MEPEALSVSGADAIENLQVLKRGPGCRRARATFSEQKPHDTPHLHGAFYRVLTV